MIATAIRSRIDCLAMCYPEKGIKKGKHNNLQIIKFYMFMYWHMDHVGVDIRADTIIKFKNLVHLFAIATFKQS